ncbi:MAG: endonuclease MutS2 [Lentisphaeria bacterium]|nr:endonuclease MutS2 [Lentisphaeria bacterium]
MSRGEEHSRQVLGYGQLLEEIAGYVQSTGGRRRVLALRPQTSLPAIQARRGLYEDLMHLEETAKGIPSLGAEDLSAILLRVQPQEAILDGSELRLCLAQLQLVWEVRIFLQDNDIQDLTCLQNRGSGLDSCDSLRMALFRAIDADGSVLDNASERLRELRRNKAATERHLQHTLEELVKNTAGEGILQDNFVTQRNGRYVVPVRREAQRNMPGLVHDVSSTGQTLFIEPTATLSLGNELSTISAEEREEVRRILAQLSEGVRTNRDAMRQNSDILEDLDAAAAVAKWASDYSCVLPSFGGFLQLSNARHPLLSSQFRRESQGRKVVPLDLQLPPGTTTLAITGSNTGGKTVTLKTIGLLALAAQSGLPVPVGQDSLFTVFQRILADIGDEQSLSENLSTFSGHLSNIGEVLREAAKPGKSLVLLDELGSGTDPVEGGAIACAVLKELSRQKALTVTTTHLGSVKNFVHLSPNMVNGAVRFNLSSLQPEYVLELGRPGASHALAIAKRLGIPQHVLKSAEGFLTGDELQLEDLLSRLEKEHRDLLQKNAAAEAARRAAEADREEWKKKLAELKNTRKQKLNDAFQEAQSLVDNARRDLENLQREIREKAKQKNEPDTVKEMVDQARKAIVQKQQDLETGARQTTVAPAVKPLQQKQLTVGKRIWVERLSSHGRILRIDGHRKELEVDVNGMTFTIKTREVFPELEPEKPKADSSVTVHMPLFQGQTSHEILLVGLRVEDAVDRLTQYLNDCVLANLNEVRVVHGFGTGRLREGIHQFLRKQPYVESFYLGSNPMEGGAGVTYVRLK